MYKLCYNCITILPQKHSFSFCLLKLDYIGYRFIIKKIPKRYIFLGTHHDEIFPFFNFRIPKVSMFCLKILKFQCQGTLPTWLNRKIPVKADITPNMSSYRQKYHFSIFNFVTNVSFFCPGFQLVYLVFDRR